ncbi:hypothetical protein PHMEG_00016237 [Phytophthora megakarya]|uniref:Uncharacterized protein n=1 Tax=Phytophthora megakarya TaxID=4795 RepID=A0A225VZA5_9STRA|nr:hypothetical protein PHMEG_00016237 [Phytophthora megakarya]
MVNATKTKFRFQKEGLAGIGSLSHHGTRSSHKHRHFLVQLEVPNDDEDDSHARSILHRIKERARAEFHRQHQYTDTSSTSEIDVATRSNAPAGFFEEIRQQEVSNDALRRQLDLLRRLQLENNRFRQEARSLREQNDSLRQRGEIREREMKRLCDEVSELDAKVQRDQTSLVTISQTQHKMKATQNKLTAVTTEIREIQTALQEARDARDQLQSESQLKISDLMMEVKRWKRNTKQLHQQENSSAEEIELYKKTVAALEQEITEWRSKFKDAKREISELTSIVEEKTVQCASVETSAAECVKRMEEDMEAVQKTHTHEREKRKKIENVRDSLQMKLERMQAENALLMDKQCDLEHQLTQFREHWKERKEAYQDQLQRFGAQLEEHVSKHKSDAATICSLREEYETIEQRFGEAEAVAIEFKNDVAEEGRTVQTQVEALRKYVERALHDTNTADEVLKCQLETGRLSREQEVPELRFVQGAVSALRNETMNIVHEFQRARHLVRQQGSKLTRAVERVTELEHLRAKDAENMKELRKQRKLVEQAHDIVNKEKVEVLKWSEKTCEKKSELEAELKKCEQLVLRLRKELHHTLGKMESWVESEAASAEPLAQSILSLEIQIDSLVSLRDRWRAESENLSHDLKEIQSQVKLLEKEQSTKATEHKQTLEDVEQVHRKNTQEQKLRFEQYVADIENERSALEAKLQAESAKVAGEEESNAKLQQVVDGFEQDLPVFATILHLFVLVVQPLILQVSDLLAQKRYLSRENIEFAQANEQIKCIGDVLKEMIPSATPDQQKVKERLRQRIFRRVVIAIFAMNRFRTFQSSVTSSDELSAYDLSAYGHSAPLKVVTSRKRVSALSAQPTIIKVLHPQQTLSRLSFRPLLERLKKMEITEKVTEAIESNTMMSGYMPSSFGNLILKVVMAINPASKEVLVANTNGMFHCQALLERRRRSTKKRVDQHGGTMDELVNAPVFEEDIPTVVLIRKRILALGKRVEDLLYQRNSLQKENYEFQLQLDQQANSLNEMEGLLKKTETLQEEIAALCNQNDQELDKSLQIRRAKDREIQSKEDELVKAQEKIETLQAKVSNAENRIEQMGSEQSRLGRELDQMKSTSTEEADKAGKSEAAARRQEDEVRSLKQAVKKAHELCQKVSCQLEQEVQEKSALQTVVNHLRRQQERMERDVRAERLRELEKSFNEDILSDGSDDERYGYMAKKMKKKTSFASSIEVNGVSECSGMLSVGSTSCSRKCEDSIPDISDRSKCISGSPLSRQWHSIKSHSSKEVDNLMNEWQQLGVSRALSDNHSPRRETRIQSDSSDSSKLSSTKSPISPKNVSWNAATNPEKSTRQTEVDKVNAAVHDYMDRIDDKLKKMYGIPPSSAIQRTVHHKISMAGECKPENANHLKGNVL